MLFSAVLIALVAVLAWLQYKWLGDVSQADRARRQTILRQRASEFADDFDREITRAYLSFQIDASTLDRDPSAFAARYDAWRQNARAPQLVRAVYLVDGSASDPLREYRSNDRAFVPAAWPADLQPIRDRLGLTPFDAISLIRDPIVASIPAAIIPLPQVQNFDPAALPSFRDLHIGFKAIVVVLDREYLSTTFLPALADRYFPHSDVDAYRFALVDPRRPGSVIFSRGLPAGTMLTTGKADATVTLFSVRFELADRLDGMPVFKFNTGAPPRSPLVGRGQMSVFVERRATTVTKSSADGRFEVSTNVRSFPSAAWQLVLQHPAGSLDAAVAATRRRNLGLSFGILALLGTSVVLIVLNAQRSQRLAAQQMDFVATVTHELRTPLTVIRSAAQNLSAGVVHDSAQTRRYGDLIDTEGRRLSEMVEQVLDYAGMSDRTLRNAAPADVSDLVHEVVGSFETLAAAEGIQLDVKVDDDLPPVMADAAALRQALQNLLTNALKYGSAGRWIGIEAKRAAARGPDDVQISVSDRGRGIDPGDLPHIFEPFYRGTHAVTEQIHGNGLGLSLVKRIVEAHDGRISVKTAPGEGAVFTIGLRGSEVFSTENASSVPEVGRVEPRPTAGT